MYADMEAEAFRVRNFKCIEDSGWVDIEDVTSLIGKNQSGKTAFLEAITKLNPVYGSGDYEPYKEYPRDGWTEYKNRKDTDPDVVAQAKYRLNGAEKAEIETEFGIDLLESNVVKLSKNYKNELLWEVDIDESLYVDDFLEDYDLPGPTESMLEDSETIEELVDNIHESDSERDVLDQLIEDLDPTNLDLPQQIGSRFLEIQIPEMLYMGEYHFLKDEISMDQLMNRDQQDNLDEGDEIFLSLLSINNLNPSDLQNDENWDRIRTELESAANNVTDYLLDYWSQNQNFQIKFDRNYIPQSSGTMWNDERIIEVLVEDLDFRASIAFDQQSRGFRWFFSVFCKFTEMKQDDQNQIVLLDEPGLHLHAKAQQDFLTFLNHELSNQHRVIFTTHSPFMIDPRNLHQAKMVEADPDRGTDISEDVMRTGEDTRLPLQNAFEFDLIDTLLIRPHTLLVEGKSDHSYLYTMSEILDDDRTSLNRKWTVIPVGSGSNVPTFVSLFGGNDLDLSVLLDADGNEMQRKDDIESKDVMESSHIQDISEFIEENHGDIEDLFSVDFYMELVNEAYAGEIAQNPDVPNHISVSDFKEDNQRPRIAKRLEKYFDRYHINEGVFEHYKPAEYLQENRDRMKEKLDEESVENFERLFEDFNSILEDFD